MRATEFITEKWSAEYKRSINCSNPKGFSQKAHCAGRKKNEGVAENFADDMSTKDMIAYLRQHHDKNLHPDYLNHLTNTNSKFVLKNIPLTSIKTELAGLDRAKVAQYQKMDFSKAPPIVVGSDGNILDGYHRATAAKALNIPTIKAYVGIKGQQGVSESTLNEYRNALYDFVKSKFPTWPEYVLKDFLYAQAKGIQDQEELKDFLDRNQKDFGQVKWRLEKLPITLDIFTPKTQRMIKQREGGSSNPFQVPRDTERHAQQLKMIQQQGVRTEPIIVAKLNNGYDLIEGWHRTIQHLQQYPEGYTGPAWVAYGATYTSESKQGVAKGSLNEFAIGGDDGEDPTDNYPCYDCGSTIFLHHTKLCELAEPNAIRDLPAKPGSQHWTGQVPKGLHPIPGLQEGVAEGLVDEGVNDPHIFKCIFLFGPMGAGKSTIARPLLSHTGLRSVNLDNFNEMMIKKGQVPTGHLSSDQLEKNWQLTQKQQTNFVDGRLGIIIDGSGRNPDTAIGVIEQLQPLGYEFAMIFVNVSEATSIARQQSRAEKQAKTNASGVGRQVDPTLAKNTYAQVQKMLGRYSAYFGPQRFIYVDNENTPNLTDATKKVDTFLNAPIVQPAAKEWIASQQGGQQIAQKQQKLATAQDRNNQARRQFQQGPLNPKFRTRKEGVAENFADGKVKGKSRPGRVKAAGASCDGSVTDLRARAKKYSGEKGKMYHWCANMKAGKKK